MKVIWLAVITILMCFLNMGCTNNLTTSVATSTPTATQITFTPSQAIARVVNGESEYPTDPNKPIIRLENNGGPYLAKTNISYSTKVQKLVDNSYIVTLTKEPVGNKMPRGKGYWKYYVTPYEVELIEYQGLPKYY